MKHILIDGTTISRQIDGLSQYILNVVSKLPLQRNCRYTIVVRPNECPEDYLSVWQKRGIEIVTAEIAPIGPKREWQYRRLLKQLGNIDAALLPSNQYPTCFDGIKSIYVIHDIIYERYPEQLGKMAACKRWWLHRNVRMGLKHATEVVAVSEYTRQEVLRCHHAAKAEKIHVIYEGWEHLEQLTTADNPTTGLSQYVLYVGSSRGHKNLQRLIDAMLLTEDKIAPKTGLVIAGDNKLFTQAQWEKIQQMKGRIVTTGWLNQEQLQGYFQGAKAVIFPSLCEGFGIPVLEAFYYHKPLLVSNCSSLPEVAGEAGIYFDPTDTQDMANQIVNALKMNEEEANRWIAKGTERLQAFSWQNTANQIDQILQKIL